MALEKISSLDPTKKAFSLFEEFKAFAFKGNVIDLAVGVIIGAAFGKIIDSLVKHIIMPLIGIIMPGEQGYQGWKWVVNGVEIPFGLFLGEIVNFLVVALALFIFIVKFLGWIMKSKKEEAAAPAPPPLEATLNLEAVALDPGRGVAGRNPGSAEKIDRPVFFSARTPAPAFGSLHPARPAIPDPCAGGGGEPLTVRVATHVKTVATPFSSDAFPPPR